MDNSLDEMKTAFTLCCGVIVGTIVTMVIFYNTIGTYKQGQIDAINGKIKYELVTNKDWTKTWGEIVVENKCTIQSHVH